MVGGQPVLLHGADHLGLIVLRHRIDGCKTADEAAQHFLTEAQHGVADAHLVVNCVGLHIFLLKR